MVLIGLIVIVNVLMALLLLGVPRIQWKLPVPTASRPRGPGSARLPRR